MAKCIVIYNSVLEGAEFKKLTHSEIIAYLFIRKNYVPGKDTKIFLSYKDISDILSSRTFSRAIKGLLDKGWIKRTQHGGLHRYYNYFEITWKYDIKPRNSKSKR